MNRFLGNVALSILVILGASSSARAGWCTVTCEDNQSYAFRVAPSCADGCTDGQCSLICAMSNSRCQSHSCDDGVTGCCATADCGACTAPTDTDECTLAFFLAGKICHQADNTGCCDVLERNSFNATPSGGSFTTSDGASILVPPDSVPTTVELVHFDPSSEQIPIDLSLTTAGFWLTRFSRTLAPGVTFLVPITISYRYAATDVPAPGGPLTVWRFDPLAGQYTQAGISIISRDPLACTITFTTDRTGRFFIAAQSPPIPALSAIGMILAVLILLCGGMVMLFRRRYRRSPSARTP